MISFVFIMAIIVGVILAGVSSLLFWRARLPKKDIEMADGFWPLEVEKLKDGEGVGIVPRAWYGRLLYVFATIVTPIAGFLFNESSLTGQAEWQSGNEAYLEILLGGGVNLYFYPFALFAIVSMVLLLLNADRFAPLFLVRLGIYSGTILVIHYIGLMAVTQYFWFALMLGVPTLLISYGLYKSYHFAVAKWGQKETLRRAALYLGIPFMIGVVATMGSLLAWIPFGIWMAGFCAILPLTAVTSWRLWQTYETPKLWRISHSITAGAWFGAYIFTWSRAVVRMNELYLTLPESPPDCYIATAAAQGHHQVVGSKQVGRVMVNRQLQTLKAAEMALLATTPKFHCWLRKGYDVYGRFLATKLTNPFVADIAYLTLKPFEWGSRLVLWLVVPNAGAWIGRFYTS